jgi:hypothetical protein
MVATYFASFDGTDRKLRSLARGLGGRSCETSGRVTDSVERLPEPMSPARRNDPQTGRSYAL